MSYLDDLIASVANKTSDAKRAVSGSIGKAINNIRPTGDWSTNLANSLESFGGGGSGSTFQWVPKAQASEPTSYRNDLGGGSVDPLADSLSQYTNSSQIGAGIGGNSGTGNPVAKVPTDNNNNNDGGLSAQIALARAAAEEGRRRAQAAFDRARGIYDEGIGLVNKRRGEFKDIYNTGQNEILGSYEGERGNLQASNENYGTNMRNSLRALGLGGSALVSGLGRQRQQAAKAAGQLATDRAANDRENLSGYNTNQDFANQQETSLGRFLQDAQNARSAAEAQTSLAEQGDVGQINQNVNSLLGNIYAQQAALQAARGNISGYQANPYTPNISSMLGALNGGAANIGGNQTQGNQAGNVVQDSTLLSLLDPNKRVGGSIYAN